MLSICLLLAANVVTPADASPSETATIQRSSTIEAVGMSNFSESRAQTLIALGSTRSRGYGEPSSGLAWIIVGGLMTGGGVIDLASASICKAESYEELVGRDAANGCFIASLVIGGALVIAGVPILWTGLSKRSAWNDWHRRYGQPTVRYQPTSNATVVGWAIPMEW